MANNIPSSKVRNNSGLLESRIAASGLCATSLLFLAEKVFPEYQPAIGYALEATSIATVLYAVGAVIYLLKDSRNQR